MKRFAGFLLVVFVFSCAKHAYFVSDEDYKKVISKAIKLSRMTAKKASTSF